MRKSAAIVSLFTALVIAGMLYPIHGVLSKAATIIGLLGLAVALVALCRRRKFLRFGLVLVVLASCLMFALPGRAWDRLALRGRYTDNLRSYECTRYVWGGEGPLGIDCSGLPRRAYRDALLAEGFRTFNPALTRRWLDQWWHDAGARAMAEGAGGRLTPLPNPDALASDDGLEPGDVAIVNADTHVVVYLGDGHWIEADPGAEKVIVHDARQDGRSFLGRSPKVLRWRELAE
jgi:hypothetical protein